MRHRLATTRFALLAILLVSCNTPFWTPPPPTPVPLRPRDHRTRVVGTWVIQFQLDSTLGHPVTTPAPIVQAIVTLKDTIMRNGKEGLLGNLQVDFRPMLGRQITCFEWSPSIF